MASEASPSDSPTTHNFFAPSKRILTADQLVHFQQSPTHSEIVSFVEELNDAVKGVKLGDREEEVAKLPIIKAVVSMIEEVEGIAKQTPPVPNAASRFGNPAFREFYDRVNEVSERLHETYLVPLGLPKEAIVEVKVYFDEMWGNRTRIDYGSGMELNWLCWTLCLRKLGLLPPETNPFIPTRIFWKYITTMRLLQSTYWLEPAGSHGVWGLDDYHFLPFLWGSGQLKGHKYIRPRAIHDAEVVEEYGSHWMYFGCIGFINSIKTASLRWHSPMLDDISAVKTWDKVNSGMIKMYLAEVLGKLPVMQHFLFGSLIAYPSSPSLSSPSPTAVEGEDHQHKEGQACSHSHAPRSLQGIHPKVLASLQARGELPPGATSLPSEGEGKKGGAGQRDVGWGDCCGIPVPSVFGAAAEEGQRRAEGAGLERGGYKLSGVRPVPFD